MKSNFLVLSAVAVTVMSCASVQAATFQIEFSGTISRLTSNLDPDNVTIADTFSVGGAVGGIIRFNTVPYQTFTLEDDVAIYDAVDFFSISAGGLEYRATIGDPFQQPAIVVENDARGGSFTEFDRFRVASRLTEGPSVGALLPSGLQFDAFTSVLGTLDGVEIPTIEELGTLFGLNEGTGNTNSLSFRTEFSGVAAEVVRFDIDSAFVTDVTVPPVPSQVPLPATAWMLGLGLAGFGAVTRTQVRKT